MQNYGRKSNYRLATLNSIFKKAESAKAWFRYLITGGLKRWQSQ